MQDSTILYRLIIELFTFFIGGRIDIHTNSAGIHSHIIICGICRSLHLHHNRLVRIHRNTHTQHQHSCQKHTFAPSHCSFLLQKILLPFYMHKIPLYFSFALAPKYKRILSFVISSIFFMQAPAHTYPAQKRSPHPCHNIYIRQDGRRRSPSVPSLQAPYTVRKALRSSHH